MEVSTASDAYRKKLDINRTSLEELLKGRFFFGPAFSIYGGVAGLYDYGPPGCAVKANILAKWRQHFILEDNMLEIDCPCVTPEPVLEASGHVEKFKDFMVRDVVTKDYFRADHLLEEHIDKLLENPKLTPEEKNDLLTVRAGADSYSQEELESVLKKFNVRAPKTNNEITAPFPFNLMFATSIGPGSAQPGFMRPELAQGIFLNFARLLEANGGRVPFAAAQIGQAFRNEIAPRSGLLRVREFTLAEIEHFLKEDDSSHPKFDTVKDIEVWMYPRDNQLGSKIIVKQSIGKAVAEGTIVNEIVGYYMGRIYLFLLEIGIKEFGVRFRQHQSTEMAHYAKDCWDAEILTTHGWIECVGLAHRGCYDLSVHSKRARLSVYESFPEPRVEDVWEAKPNKGALGGKFKGKAQALIKFLENIENESAESIQKDFDTEKKAKVKIEDFEYELTPELVKFVQVKKKINGRTFIPHVIEPSFGIGRIIYAVFEHSYYIRENDEKRGVLALPPGIAPVKASVLPLLSNQKLTQIVPRIVGLLTANGISSKVDTVQSIGRRYARTDEIGIPFGITIDYTTVEDETVTLRNRDKTSQIRIKIDEVASLIKSLVENKLSWADVESKYPKFEAVNTEND